METEICMYVSVVTNAFQYVLIELGTSFSPQSQPLVKHCQFGVSPVNYSDSDRFLAFDEKWIFFFIVQNIITLFLSKTTSYKIKFVNRSPIT